MKITLSPNQRITLGRAPNDWEVLPANISTTTLRLMGLIEIRDEPGEYGLYRGFQWRITPFGARVIHNLPVDEQMPDCAFIANQVSVDPGRCRYHPPGGLCPFPAGLTESQPA